LRSGKDRFEPVLFTAHRDGEALLKLKKEFPRALLALSGAGAPVEDIDFYGKPGLLEAINAAGADIAVNGIAGAAGLEPSAAVLRAGSDLALANKETVVMAGHSIFALGAEKKARIIPVDSEHSAVFKLLEAHGRDNAGEIILTASGGPFRNYPTAKLAAVTPREALAHPTWNMGPKITVDSATLANKGLEVIEAARFFGFSPENITVTVHPQSVIHSMIRLKDGAVYAQMSKPDMRLPIHEALSWPETVWSPFGVLDFDSLTLTFEKPGFERFPLLSLAYDALRGPPPLTTVYNAANEKAVEAFFMERAGFLEIPCIVEYVLSQDWSFSPGDGSDDIEAVLDWDRKARELAEDYIRRFGQHA
jgi:1-deoxy-D-xylulose-5-phosphate reductoisomerase